MFKCDNQSCLHMLLRRSHIWSFTYRILHDLFCVPWKQTWNSGQAFGHVYISFFSSRRRRAANYVIFTEDQVHLLPGYPKQISIVPLLASVAFYLQFPPGSSTAVIQKDTLASIVKGSLAKISSAINANITSVEVLIADTTTSTSTVHTTYPTEKEESKTMYYIVGGCVAGAVVLIIVVIVAVWCCKREKNGYVVIILASQNQKTRA